MSDSNSAVMDPIDLEIEANKEKAWALAEELKNLNQDTHEKETIKKGKSKINEKRTYKNDQLSHKDCKPNSIIKPEATVGRYATLRYTTLHYATLRYATLHYATWPITVSVAVFFSLPNLCSVSCDIVPLH